MKFENKIPAVITIGGKDVNKIRINGEVVWQKVEPVDADYLYVENTYDGGNTISVKQTIKGSPDSSLYSKTLQYSKDKTNWSTIILSSTAYNINLNQGERLYFRGNEGVLNYYGNDGALQAITNILGTQNHTIGGNINTLVNYITPNELTLTQGVFALLFQNNTTITSAENLTLPPSSDGSLSNYAYYLMFSGCSALITPPSEIPATKQGHASCGKMFLDCTSLITPPALKSTILRNYCFTSIFKNCTSLISSPELPALTLTPNCYQSAFQGCSKLNNVTVYADDISATDCTTNWLSGVASSGTFNNMGSATYPTNSASGIPTGWTEVKPNEPDYLYIENVDETDGQITFTTTTSSTLPSSNLYTSKVEYSADKTNWNTINFDASTPQVIPLNIGEKLYFRNDSGVFNCYDNGYYLTTIKTNTKSNVGGNLNTLLNYNEEILDISDKPSCFRWLFKGSKIVDASNLVMPATTLSRYCYAEFFSGNSTLIAPPELPAVNLADNCYYNFFYGCSSLNASPSLPATTLAVACYMGMYERCYKLTTAPVLVATNLVKASYKEMFASCWKLSSVTIYANTIADNALYDWLRNVESSGTIYNYGVLPLPEKTTSGVPNGWKEEFPPIESVTANPNTFTMKSFETSVKCASTLTITTTTGITSTVNNSTTVVVGENTGDTTRTIPYTLDYRGIPYEVTIIQTANDPTE